MRKIHLPANVEFVGIPEIPALTAKAAHPVDIEGRTSVTLYQVQMQHAGALRAAIKDRTVVPLDRMSFARVPDTDEGSYSNAVIARADFEQFAKLLSIEVDSDAPEEVNPPNDKTLKPVTRNGIIDAFCVMPNAANNRKFWDKKLSDPPQWLRAARTSCGKRGVSALWNPLLVAHALLGKKHMTAKRLDDVMRNHFSAQSDEWREQTRDVDR